MEIIEAFKGFFHSFFYSLSQNEKNQSQFEIILILRLIFYVNLHFALTLFTHPKYFDGENFYFSI